MAKFLDLSVNGIALGAVSGGTNQTQALLSTATSNVLQLSGANTSTLCRLTGLDQPTSDTDAANKLYVQSYVLGQIRGLQMKQAVKLCSTVPINFTGGSLEHTSTILRWASPPDGNLLTVADDNGVTLNTSAYLSTSSSKWTVAYKWRYPSTNAVDGVLNFSSGLANGQGGDFVSIGPNAFLRTSGTFYYGTGGQQQIEFNTGGWGQFPGNPARFWFNQSVFPPNSDIYFLYTFDGATATGTCSVATYSGGVFTLPTPLTNTGGYPGTNPGTYTGATFTPGAPITALTLSKQGSTFSNLLIANKIMTFLEAFGPAPAGWKQTGLDGGQIPTALDRVLLTAQTSAIQNGIWQVDAGGNTLIRPVDYSAGASAAANFVFTAGPGVAHDDQGFLCTTLPGQDVVDTNPTTWMQYTSSGGSVGSLTMGTDSITTASGTLSLVSNNLTTTGTVISTGAVHGTLSVQAGNIYDSSGQINFSTDNLVTSGTVKPGTLSLAAGSITDTTGAITFGSDNLTTTGSMTAPHFLTVSDERLKQVTSDLEITPDIYAALRPVNFNWKASGQADVGLIAQEVQAAAPHAVNKDTNSPEGYLYVDYAALVPYALAIAKRATDRVAALERQTELAANASASWSSKRS